MASSGHRAVVLRGGLACAGRDPADGHSPAGYQRRATVAEDVTLVGLPERLLRREMQQPQRAAGVGQDARAALAPPEKKAVTVEAIVDELS
jgi:hypothetical protein